MASVPTGPPTPATPSPPETLGTAVGTGSPHVYLQNSYALVTEQEVRMDDYRCPIVHLSAARVQRVDTYLQAVAWLLVAPAIGVTVHLLLFAPPEPFFTALAVTLLLATLLGSWLQDHEYHLLLATVSGEVVAARTRDRPLADEIAQAIRQAIIDRRNSTA